MILSVWDAQYALEVLTGKKNPSVVELSDEQYRFYLNFIKPLFVSADKPMAAGIVKRLNPAVWPGKDPAERLVEINGGTLPEFAWPAGTFVYFWKDEESRMCSHCALRHIDSIVNWTVDLSGNMWTCSGCGKTVFPLGWEE